MNARDRLIEIIDKHCYTCDGSKTHDKLLADAILKEFVPKGKGQIIIGDKDAFKFVVESMGYIPLKDAPKLVMDVYNRCKIIKASIDYRCNNPKSNVYKWYGKKV